MKSLDKTRQELEDCKIKCEDMRSARQDAVRELLTMQETHHAELRITNHSLQEELNAREALERRLSEMRSELEKLQNENASEWAKRERIETEKINLERENKKIKSELLDAQVSGRPGFSGMRSSSVSDTEVRILQQELLDKNKVRGVLGWNWSEFSRSKLKKNFKSFISGNHRASPFAKQNEENAVRSEHRDGPCRSSS